MKFFLKDTNILIFVYDFKIKNSYDNLDYFIKIAKDELGNKFIGTIVGNKSNLYDYEIVSEGEAKIFAEAQNYNFI